MSGSFVGMRLLQLAAEVTGLAGHWLLQSTLVVAVGLLAARLLSRRGPALASAIYRTTLVAAVLCPVVASVLAQAGLTLGIASLPPINITSVEMQAIEVPTPASATPEPAPLPPSQVAMADVGSADTAAPNALARDVHEHGAVPSGMPRSFGPATTDPTEVAAPPSAVAAAAPAIEPELARPATIVEMRPTTIVRPAVALVVVGIAVSWILGVSILLSRLALSHWTLLRLRRAAVPASSQQLHLCQQLAHSVGVRTPEVLTSPFIAGPCLAGIARPAILLPEELPVVPLTSVFIHELAHLRRHDCLWNMLRQAVCGLLFFQPLLWRLSRRLEMTAEELCDDYVVENGADRHSYADALVSLAERSWLPASSAVVPLVTFRSLLAHRVVRILDRTRHLSLSISLTALCVVLAAGLAATLSVGALGRASNKIAITQDSGSGENSSGKDVEKPNTSEPPLEDPSVGPNVKHITGVVTSPESTLAKHATVALLARRRQGHAAGDFSREQPVVLVQAACDEEGRFDLPVADFSASRYLWAHVVVRSATSAVAWRDINADAGPKIELPPITLSKPVECRGRLITLEGKAIAGLKVIVDRIGEFKNGQPSGVGSGRSAVLSDQLWPNDVVTDAEGWFNVPYVPDEMQLALYVDQEPFAPDAWTFDPRDKTAHVQIVEPAHIIIGTVVEAESGQPIPHARLTAFTGLQMTGRRSMGMAGVDGQADEKGRFRLNPYSSSKYDVTAFGPSGTPFLSSRVEFDWPEVTKEHEIRLELPRGVLLSGSLVDENSGEPIANAHVEYHPRRDNPNAKAGVSGWKGGILTDAAGKFAMGIPPGPGYVAVSCAESDYVLREVSDNELSEGKPGGRRLYLNAFASFDVPEGATEQPLSLAASRGVTVSGEIKGADGRVPETVLLVHRGVAVPFANFFRCFPQKIVGGRFELHGVPADGEFPVYLLDPTRKEARVITARGADAGKTLQAQLEPCGSLTRKTVDGEGNPLPGASESLWIVFTPGVHESIDRGSDRPMADEELADNFDRQNHWDLMSGEDGRITYEALLPGATYRLLNFDNEKKEFSIEREFQLRPGEKLELPDRVITDDEQLSNAAERWRERQKELAAKAAAATDHDDDSATAGAVIAPPLAVASVTSASSVPTASAPATAVEAPLAADAELHYRGQVLDPDGKPVTGAKVFLIYWRTGVDPSKLAPLATTAADGFFDFRLQPSDFGSGWRQGIYANLVATADGFGFASGLSSVFETTGELVKQLPPESRAARRLQREEKEEKALRLVRDDVPITGRVTTIEGKPVAGAQISIRETWRNPQESLDAWEAATSDPKADYYLLREKAADGMNGDFMAAVFPTVTADADGRFTVRGIGRERIVELAISGPEVETLLTKARTRAGKRVEVPHQWEHQRDGLPNEVYFPAEFVHVAGPSRPIVGRVTDADSGAPLAGVRVAAGQDGTFFRSGKPHIATVTDADGRYRLTGLAVGERAEIFIPGPADSDYVPSGFAVRPAQDKTETSRGVTLRRGVRVKGNVVDTRVGQPVSGRVQYLAFQNNPHVKEFPGFSRADITHESHTDEAGRFEIIVLPGPGVLTFVADDHTRFRRGVGAETITAAPAQDPPGSTKMFKTVPSFLVADNEHLLRQIDPVVGAPLEVTLSLASGVDIPGRLLDPVGNVLTGGVLSGAANGNSWYSRLGDTFVVEGYYPDAPRDLYFYHPDSELAGYYHLEGPPPAALDVTLHPAGSVRGRLFDANGASLAGARLIGDGVPSANSGEPRIRLATDADGNFLIRGLIPGRKYTVMAFVPGTTGRALVDVTVDAGAVKDFGDVKLRPLNDQAPATDTVDKTPATSAPPKPAEGQQPANGEKMPAAEKAVAGTTGATGTAKQSPFKRGTFMAKAPAGGAQRDSAATNTFVPASGMKAKQQPAEPAGDVLTVSGRVEDPQGRPLAGADVFVLHPSWGADVIRQPVAAAKSDKAGDYKIEFRKSQLERPWLSDVWRRAVVAALAPGFGPAWVEFNELQPGEPANLKLVADEPIEGRIVDLEGHPLRGVQVELASLRANAAEDLAQWEANLRASEATSGGRDGKLTGHVIPMSAMPAKEKKNAQQAAVPNRMLPTSIPQLAVQTQTDAQGRFRLAGAGRERLAALKLSGGGVVATHLQVATRTMEPIKLGGGGLLFSHIQGAKFEYAAEPSPPIEGIVRDAKSGQPIAGVRIVSERDGTSGVSGMHTVETVSDAAGHYRLGGMPKSDGNEILAVPGNDQPYFVRQFKVPAGEGLQPVKLDLELHHGIWISGQLLDRETRQPVVANVIYAPWPDNPHIDGLPEFDINYSPDTQMRQRTDSEGRFRLPGLPGRGLIEANTSAERAYPQGQGLSDIADLPGEQAMRRVAGMFAPRPDFPTLIKEIRIDEDAEDYDVELLLDAGQRVALDLTDPDGNPVGGVNVRGLWPPSQFREVTEAGPRIEVLALSPGEKRMVLVYHPERGLGKAVRVTGESSSQGPVPVNLERCATIKGRLVDDEQRPLAGVFVSFDVAGERYGNGLNWVSTDAEGNFIHELVPTGCDYAIGSQSSQYRRPRLVEKLHVAPGEIIDLGEIDLTSDKPPEPKRTPAATEKSASATDARSAPAQAATDETHELRGLVVGPDGQSIPGADLVFLAFDIKAKSDDVGHFAVTLRKSQRTEQDQKSTPWYWTTVIAAAPGFGANYAYSKDIQPGADLVLKLITDEPIEGRILDLEGRPVAGAVVRLRMIDVGPSSSDSDWIDRFRLNADRRGPVPFHGISGRDLPIPTELTTDADGRFQMRGVGRDRHATLLVSGGGVTTRSINVITRRIASFLVKNANPNLKTSETYFGSQFQCTVDPSQPIEGVVRDSVTGEALAGVRIVSQKFSGDRSGGRDLVETVSDSEGRYRLDGMPKGHGNQVLAVPSADQPYFVRDFDVPTAAGFAPVHLDLELRRGVWITGSVTLKQTGAPASASLIYLPRPGNPHIKDLPEFHRGYLAVSTHPRTDAQGRYRLVGFPGRGLVEILHVDEKPIPGGQGIDEIPDLPARAEFREISELYTPPSQLVTAVQEVDIAESAQEGTANFELDGGKWLSVDIVDPDDAPLSHATVWWGLAPRHVEDAGTSVDIVGLMPREKRWVLAFHRQRNLGKAQQITWQNDWPGPAKLVLDPCATIRGRLLSSERQPVRGARVTFDVSLERTSGQSLGPAVTDDSGDFRQDGILPGAKYRVFCESAQSGFRVLAEALAVAPGESIDLGEIDVTSQKRPEPTRTPAAQDSRAMKSEVAAVPTAATPTTPAPAADAAIDDIPKRQLTTVVRDAASGRPLSSVELFSFAEPDDHSLSIDFTKRYQLLGRTDAEGRLQISLPGGSTRGSLIAQAVGYGIGWIALDQVSADKENEIRLAADLPISGRVLSTEGRPVAGAKVSLQHIGEPRDAVEDFVLRWSKDWQDAMSSPRPQLFLYPGAPLGVTTVDADGRFTLPGAGRDRIVTVQITGPGIANERIVVVTRPQFNAQPLNEEAIEQEHRSMRRWRQTPTVSGPEVTVMAEPALVIEGVVQDDADQTPLAGCIVWAAVGWGAGTHTIAGTDGKFRLEGLPKNEYGYMVSVDPNRSASAYMRRSFHVNDAPGLGPFHLDANMHKGAVVTGRLIDRVTGKGVSGNIRSAPLPDNEYYQRPEFNIYYSDRSSSSIAEDGTFRLPTIPGRQILMVQAHGYVKFHGEHVNPFRDGEPTAEDREFCTYDKEDDRWRVNVVGGSVESLSTEQAFKIVDIKEQGETQVDLFVERGTTRQLRIEDPDGQPLTGAWVAGMTDVWPVTYHAPDSELTLYGLHDKPRTVCVYHPERKLGGVTQVRGDSDEAVVIRLAPLGSLAGCLVDDEGHPIVGADVSVNGVTTNESELYRFAPFADQPVRTGADGSFLLPSVVPSLKFYLLVKQDEKTFTGKPRIGRLSVEAGQTRDLGQKTMVVRD